MRGLATSCLPSVARSESGQAHLRALRYGGHPSPALMSAGWWTVASWNPLIDWLRNIEALRNTA